MKHAYKVLRDCVYHNPLALSVIEDKKLLEIADNMLPYSVGMEFEIEYKENETRIYNICQSLGLEHVSISSFESRFRIPSGIKGMIALYKLCDWLKSTQEMNLKSGIHYHVDFTDMGKPFEYFTYYYKHPDYEWVLQALESWNYTGGYNSKAISCDGKCKFWVCRRPELNTFEFRIGNMSFDYEYLITRVLSLQNICKKIKSQMNKEYFLFANSLKRTKRNGRNVNTRERVRVNAC